MDVRMYMCRFSKSRSLPFVVEVELLYFVYAANSKLPDIVSLDMTCIHHELKEALLCELGHNTPNLGRG